MQFNTGEKPQLTILDEARIPIILDSSAMSSRQLVIDFKKLEPYEAGALLLTYLIRPEPKASEEDLARLFRSLCHQYLSAKTDSDQEWAAQPQLIKPIYAFVDQKKLGQDIRQFKRRLRDRMVAAKMAIAYLKEVNLGKMPDLPKGIKSLSLNQLSTMVLDDLESDEAGNVESRVWRPSLPVIHIAAAIAVVIDEFERAGKGTFYPMSLLEDPELVRWILIYAEKYAEMLLKSDKIRLSPEILIRVIIAN